MRNRLLLGLVAALALLGAVACGSDDDEDTTGSTSTQSSPAATAAGVDAAPTSTPAPTTAAAAQATPAPTATGPTAITVRAGDYFYDPTDFRARPGTVVVTMTNEGPERPHTFVVKNSNGSGDLFTSERVPVGGQPVTLEFTVAEEGTYELYCSLPGHADRGQRGTLTVSRT